MIVSARYTQIMLWLARYKYLCTDQIHQYLFAGTTRRNCEIALHRMDKKGLIKRAKLPRSHHLNFGFLCYLTKEGHELVKAEERLDNVRYAKYPVIKPITSINHYYHRKRLIDFFIKLDLDIKKLPQLWLKKVLTEAGQKEEKGKRLTETKLVSGRLSIVPDLIFVLQNQETGKEAAFMVEIDTGKEAIGGKFETSPKGSLMHKFLIYEQFLEVQDWQGQIGTTAKTFQVLTITEEVGHLKTLMKRSMTRLKYSQNFMGTTHEFVEKGSVYNAPFWLTLQGDVKKLL